MDGSTATSATAPAGLVMNEGRYASNGEPPPHKKSIAFFSQDISDVSTIKRVQQFLSRGFTVTVLGFRRDRYNADFKPTWSHVLLGYTQDRRYVQRILALLTAFPKLLAARSVLDRASILYARNLDQLVLALVVRTLINREATIVYEILDIQPFRLSRSHLCDRALDRAPGPAAGTLSCPLLGGVLSPLLRPDSRLQGRLVVVGK